MNRILSVDKNLILADRFLANIIEEDDLFFSMIMQKGRGSVAEYDFWNDTKQFHHFLKIESEYKRRYLDVYL